MNLWAKRLLRHYLSAITSDLGIPLKCTDEDFEDFGDGATKAPETPTFGQVPTGRKGIISTYGDPMVTYSNGGKTVKVSKKWERRNMRLVQASEIVGHNRKIYMHRLIVPRFLQAMILANWKCPAYVIKRAGCFAPRFMRHNPKRPLSTHTWGIGPDINPAQNKSFIRKPSDPLPFEDGWEKFSDIPQGVVEAFESCGFIWGGRWGNGAKGGFCDPMHFQAARVR